MSVAEELLGLKPSSDTATPSNNPAVSKLTLPHHRSRSRPAESRPQRPDGVSRELYMLTGGVTPASIMPTIAPTPAMRHKPLQKRAWVRRPFSNSARADTLQLSHWVRVGEPEADYPFARFNKPLRIVQYTDAEYATVIEPLDPSRTTDPAQHTPAVNVELPPSKIPRTKTASTTIATPERKHPVQLQKEDIGPPRETVPTPTPTPVHPQEKRSSAVPPAGEVTAPVLPALKVEPQLSASRIEPSIVNHSAAPHQPPPASGPTVAATAVPSTASAIQKYNPSRKHGQAASQRKHSTSGTSTPPIAPRNTSRASVIGAPEDRKSSAAQTGSEDRRRRQVSPELGSAAFGPFGEYDRVNSDGASAGVGQSGNSDDEMNNMSASAAVAAALHMTHKTVQFVPLQKKWAREETDALFELCVRFDLRFPVIHDRWPDHLPSRSVDEMKDRYYSVAKALLEHRTRLDKNALAKLPLTVQKHAQAIKMNPFDYEYECIRKNQLERQYKRSKEELREEEETVRNARRIEANQKRLKKERERLAKLLTPAGDIRMTAPDGSRVVDAKVAAAHAGSVQPQKIFPHRKIVSGAFSRSSQIYTPVTQSARLAKRVDQVLEELKVGIRPTPTSHVVDNFDLLRLDILSLLELHRTVTRKEEEVHNLRVRLAKLKGDPLPPAPPGLSLVSRKRKADDGLDPSAPTPLFSS